MVLSPARGRPLARRLPTLPLRSTSRLAPWKTAAIRAYLSVRVLSVGVCSLLVEPSAVRRPAVGRGWRGGVWSRRRKAGSVSRQGMWSRGGLAEGTIPYPAKSPNPYHTIPRKKSEPWANPGETQQEILPFFLNARNPLYRSVEHLRLLEDKKKKNGGGARWFHSSPFSWVLAHTG